ncbi:Serine/threonine protein kinase [Actinokineospora alba]|uniref:non-specific serine/threonine protein kinase n=1 Tax=Actinokineospora alba TaxID=504798 RepID=A0A1H0UGG3_9PSEU|nr:serine/threonine-protein kinase [Actinokineospora alba]TDP65101.1 serine/threonine protein kinase [Actinokineospora alba]SDH54076.1 Serine/threonine protein kinase [Actinokineospora alba]SDP65307.1 Serine/threonine protein kinase [Actinokineospora alba]
MRLVRPGSLLSHVNVESKECRVIEEGQLVADRYRLLETIGSGAMGVVWRAKDERLGRVIAIKHLHVRPGLSAAQTDEARRRAMREARIAARLQHRNAIAMLDVAEHDGDPCLVMEYLESQSLSAVLAERGTLPPEQVASIGHQVAAALAAAHAAGIVHRDVKPGNILLAGEGTVKITDFGISRALGDGTITETGMLAGTPAYLAPEIARGKDPGHASDVFSLGATLYHAVEGTPPFGLNPNPLALLHAVASGRIDRPQNAGPLTSTLMSLLRTEPENRPTMAEAAATLSTPTDQLAQLAMAAEPQTRPVRPVMRPQAPLPARPAEQHDWRSSRPTEQDDWRPARPTEQDDWRPTRQADHDTRPVRHEPPATAYVPEPKRPAPARRQPDPVRTKLIAAVVGVLLLIGGTIAFIAMNAAKGDTADASPPSSSSSDRPSTTPSTAVTGAEKVTSYPAAGELVIAYYGKASLDDRWNMLGPNGKAAFADRAAFDEYWGQFKYVSSRNARGVTANSDGSVNVPVDVTTSTAAGEEMKKRTVKVILVGGKHLIDSDSR